MDITIKFKGNDPIAIIEADEILINSAQDALDLIASIYYEHSCSHAIINKNNICEEFFDLKTGVAGEILQKLSNYNFYFAIIGDFSHYNSKALNDFIYESNKSSTVNFLDSIKTALAKE